MSEPTSREQPTVMIGRHQGMMSVVLNRPRVLNSLNLEMVRAAQEALDEVEAEERFQFVLFYGAGERGFCAGGDIKALALAVGKKELFQPDEVLKEEYDLCLRLHSFSKPVLVVADGITMGAGLGLAAGADMVVATERTRMAMPETRIGFFPDVGATGWMFGRCPPGYPEYLALTGYEMVGSEAVRVGFATHLLRSERLGEFIGMLEGYSRRLPQARAQVAQQLATELDHFFNKNIPTKSDMDEWVETYFAGKASLTEIMVSLRQCGVQSSLCEGVFQRLSERSPTAVVLTLELLRHNEGRRIQQVFETDLKAARFMVAHPDYLEGVRARLLDKDDNPRWQPETIEEVGPLGLEL
jgi:enoyl-CoA hydratase